MKQVVSKNIVNFMLTLITTLAFCSPTRGAELQIDADFPGGNIIVDSISDSGVVQLRPDLRDTMGDWFYTAFRVRGAQGQALQFEFDAPNRVGARVRDQRGRGRNVRGLRRRTLILSASLCLRRRRRRRYFATAPSTRGQLGQIHRELSRSRGLYAGPSVKRGRFLTRVCSE